MRGKRLLAWRHRSPVLGLVPLAQWPQALFWALRLAQWGLPSALLRSPLPMLLYQESMPSLVRNGLLHLTL